MFFCLPSIKNSLLHLGGKKREIQRGGGFAFLGPLLAKGGSAILGSLLGSGKRRRKRSKSKKSSNII